MACPAMLLKGSIYWRILVGLMTTFKILTFVRRIRLHTSAFPCSLSTNNNLQSFVPD